MPPTQGLHICIDRVVPPMYQPARAEREAALAQDLRSAAAGVERGELNPDEVLPVARAALIDLKRWQNGRTLRCRFLDGEPTWQDTVAKKASIWHDYANITFQFIPAGDAEIRISFFADAGSWSAIGTDCLVDRYFPKAQPTMNFGWLRDDTPDQEYERVVVHEFGHALGLIHEHQSPKEHLQWNKPEVYRVFSGPPNYWSTEEIDHNILEKYSPAGITATRFDKLSIMLYQFPGSLFLDGKGTPLNTTLSQLDEQFIAGIYRKG